MMRYAALLLLFLATTASAAEPEKLRSIEVVGTRFQVTTESGQVLPQEALIGAMVSYRDGDATIPVRIDKIWPDPQTEKGELLLYGFSIRDPGTGAWKEMCQADAYGIRGGFPLQLGEGKGFTLTCTSGSQGKCVRFGYHPWGLGPHGEALQPYWEACNRMVRADYCGDGKPHTRDGTLIDLFDKIGLQTDEPVGEMSFEAGWSPEGAVCVRRTRLSDVYSLDALRRECPRLKPEDIGEGCTEQRARQTPAVLLMNRSLPR